MDNNNKDTLCIVRNERTLYALIIPKYLEYVICIINTQNLII